MKLPLAILTSDALEPGHTTKPSPEIRLHCMESLGVSLNYLPIFTDVGDYTF